MSLPGRVQNGVVVLENGAGAAPLPDGTLVEVSPVGCRSHGASASTPVSKEQQQALLAIIGLWQVENPPSDEEVERIIEETRMKKYG